MRYSIGYLCSCDQSAIPLLAKWETEECARRNEWLCRPQGGWHEVPQMVGELLPGIAALKSLPASRQGACDGNSQAFRRWSGPIDPTLRLHEDLGIADDDAVDLINRIHKDFGTSFESFEFTDYFPDETEAIFYLTLIPLGWSRKKSISVRHLVDVVNAGKWFEEGLLPPS